MAHFAMIGQSPRGFNPKKLFYLVKTSNIPESDDCCLWQNSSGKSFSRKVKNKSITHIDYPNSVSFDGDKINDW